MINFLEIEKNNLEHIKILFDILKKRDKNISHQSVPEFDDHVEFVKKNPYRKWFFIISSKGFIGTIYVTYENTIGINVINEESFAMKCALEYIFKTIKPLPAIPSVRNKLFSVNLSPNNITLKKVLVEIDAELIQETYIIKFI